MAVVSKLAESIDEGGVVSCILALPWVYKMAAIIILIHSLFDNMQKSTFRTQSNTFRTQNNTSRTQKDNFRTVVNLASFIKH